MAKFIEVRVTCGPRIKINPDMVASIEPSRHDRDETDIHFSNRVISISMPFDRAVALIEGSSV